MKLENGKKQVILHLRTGESKHRHNRRGNPMSRKSFHWEIVFALFINSALLLSFFLFKGEQKTEKRNPPTEIAVDISDFTPPIPKQMNIPDTFAEQEGHGVSLTKMTISADVKTVPSKPTLFLPLLPVQEIVPQKTFKEHYDDLARIEDGVRTFDGFNQVKAGIQEGTLPAGHRVGTSFRLRSDSMARSQAILYFESLYHPFGPLHEKASVKIQPLTGTALTEYEVSAFFVKFTVTLGLFPDTFPTKDSP